jgi:hypothetical protein
MYRTKFSFITGNVPGCPKQRGETCVFGASPYCAATGAKALLLVNN